MWPSSIKLFASLITFESDAFSVSWSSFPLTTVMVWLPICGKACDKIKTVDFLYRPSQKLLPFVILLVAFNTMITCNRFSASWTGGHRTLGFAVWVFAIPKELLRLFEDKIGGPNHLSMAGSCWGTQDWPGILWALIRAPGQHAVFLERNTLLKSKFS